MENQNNKESYLHRRAEQLQQWERVIIKLESRADKSQDKYKSDLILQIKKIQEIKDRTELMIRQLRVAETIKWDELKTNLEESWLKLREAFLEASAKG